MQLTDVERKTQLRRGYNADIFWNGEKTDRVYTPQELKEYGLSIGIKYVSNSYFSINGIMAISSNAPTYINDKKTAYSYSVEIIDGTRNYEKMEQFVEVYVPLAGTTYSLFNLSDGIDIVENEGQISRTTYLINFAFTLYINDSSDGNIGFVGRNEGNINHLNIKGRISANSTSTPSFGNLA